MRKRNNKITDKEYTGRGLALYIAVSLSTDTNDSIAQRAGYKANTLYNHFKKEFLADSIMIKYGKAIPHDFSIDFPELAPYFRSNPIGGEKSYTDLKIQFEGIQQKYTNLLESHNELLRAHAICREELSDANRTIKELSKEIRSLKK
ncbi:keratin [Sphingobacterium sp. DR205]|uniref:keratin n=1 Tax=Sphingobacterium sp. DR205 TaxID=2713573 RepID=UPI0013E412F9|nr:keratin [Sphingobacterium sp. DR205]QIH36726.1 keratin [Sphingobacterium sp. DR205]